MKYKVDYTSNFKKQHKKISKQGKDLNKLHVVINALASDGKLDRKYKDHHLVKNKIYKNCRECHIEPDWLLVYKKKKDKLILVLFATGSHADLFDK